MLEYPSIPRSLASALSSATFIELRSAVSLAIGAASALGSSFFAAAFFLVPPKVMLSTSLGGDHLISGILFFFSF